MKISKCKDEIISFVMNSSDADNLILSTFIAGMQVNKSVSSSELNSNSKKGNIQRKVADRNQKNVDKHQSSIE